MPFACLRRRRVPEAAAVAAQTSCLGNSRLDIVMQAGRRLLDLKACRWLVLFIRYLAPLAGARVKYRWVFDWLVIVIRYIDECSIIGWLGIKLTSHSSQLLLLCFFQLCTVVAVAASIVSNV